VPNWSQGVGNTAAFFHLAVTVAAVSAIRGRLRKYLAAREIAGIVRLIRTPDRVIYLEATGIEMTA
jgi:hypothetical protein